LLETEPAEPLLDLRRLPWIAAAAHGPKRPQRFAERIGLRWKHAEHQPAAWNERAIGVLHGRRRDLQGKERRRIPNDSERFLVVEIDDALCAQSDALLHTGCGDVGARKLQCRLPDVDANNLQRWPDLRRLDRQPTDARADVEERTRACQRLMQSRSLRCERIDLMNNST